MDEKIAKLFLPVLDRLYNTEPAGEPFRKPVDVVKYGCFDYYCYVKHPIDLSTIRDRLTGHQYKDAWRFVADIQLMFSNAYLFNKKGTHVYEFTNKLSKIWNSELPLIMQRLNYCCGTLHKFGPQLLLCHGTTPDRYCQIPIGAKYKCYQDQYSFCIPCFNKINTEFVTIQGLACETARMTLPTQPVRKTEFVDCANDHWQYESFLQCASCSRRVHQICELYPADEDQIKACIQHEQLETEQKDLCQVPEQYRVAKEPELVIIDDSDTTMRSSDASNQGPSELSSNSDTNTMDLTDQDEKHDALQGSLDDELVRLARDVEENSHLTSWAPTSPTNQTDERLKPDNKAKEASISIATCSTTTLGNIGNGSNTSSKLNPSATNLRNSVDSIAARLSINKLGAESQCSSFEPGKRNEASPPLNRDKFMCNYCYAKQKVGFNLRHRKYSARRLPHTRMSRYIETKVNEHIRDNSPTAGEVTIRVLTAYRDIVEVKQEMRDYVRRTKAKNSHHHPFLNDYPEEFGYTNRAIFAWQEIDGVDVCVFGMHVQEYGDDCPEPNRQVIYLSYIDSVHFFRPKQVRTAVYHEILLSYFRYVKKLGFRRVFIWVCPSRKGDDYIFYRHPSEQKMPTLKRLSDWYVNLLDKGIRENIIERHQSIYDFAKSQSGAITSILDLPYLSGDYWPGEFERLLKLMIESQKVYETRLRERGGTTPSDSSDTTITTATSPHLSIAHMTQAYAKTEPAVDRLNMISLSSLYQQKPASSSTNGKVPSTKGILNSVGLKPSPASNICAQDVDYCFNTQAGDDSKLFGTFTPDSVRSEDQPLDLSQSSKNTSPESYFDDDLLSESSFNLAMANKKKRRKPTSALGYTKKRNRSGPSTQVVKGTRHPPNFLDGSKFASQSAKSSRAKANNSGHKDLHDVLLDPETELLRNLDRSVKRQESGFIVARLNDCDCSPHFESQRRKEEVNFTCEMMRGREPFLQLARLKNYEFSTLRRAKFSSLAMVKHLAKDFKLEPICNECYSFDSSKRHYACPCCEDYYLCTSCHENTHHDHIMSLTVPTVSPDIDEFLQQCSLTSATNSISSASSTISNKSYTESNDINPQVSKIESVSPTATPLNRHLSNSTLTRQTMPLSCQRQKNRGAFTTVLQVEDLENANICPFGSNSKLHSLPNNQPSPPPSHLANDIQDVSPNDLDRVLMENFIRHAEISYDVDFDQMKNESKKLLTHYWACPSRESCHKCKFVVLSCSFMSVLMRSSRMQMVVGDNVSNHIGVGSSNTISNNPISGINLTTTPKVHGYQPKEK